MTDLSTSTDDRRVGVIALADVNGEEKPVILNGVVILNPDGTVPDGSVAAIGAVDDAPYDDETGADPGTVISLLKGIYINTLPA